ncbi:MAG: tetratricopeptide repeat protein [Chthoniobacterales bacterium]|nr:tetratricopeptide repeat protein [Chthoniobacterales bacterium]
MEERRDSVLLPSVDPELELTSSDLFWQEHWRKFVVGLVAVVVAILVVGAWMLYTSHERTSSEALYSLADTPEALREVIEKYPGSVPAGNAQLRLATLLRSEGKLDEAVKELDEFLARHSNHPLAGAAWLTLGEVRQMQGDKEAALEAYRKASASYPKSYAAPLALLAEAKLIASQGSEGEARAILESVGITYPGTPAAMVAGGELGRMGAHPSPGAQ